MVTGNWALTACSDAGVDVVGPVEQPVREKATAARAAVAVPAVFSRARRGRREATGLLRVSDANLSKASLAFEELRNVCVT
jgi:hypothetical protein